MSNDSYRQRLDSNILIVELTRGKNMPRSTKLKERALAMPAAPEVAKEIEKLKTMIMV